MTQTLNPGGGVVVATDEINRGTGWSATGAHPPGGGLPTWAWLGTNQVSWYRVKGGSLKAGVGSTGGAIQGAPILAFTRTT